jgi:hypothetical protein
VRAGNPPGRPARRPAAPPRGGARTVPPQRAGQPLPVRRGAQLRCPLAAEGESQFRVERADHDVSLDRSRSFPLSSTIRRKVAGPHGHAARSRGRTGALPGALPDPAARKVLTRPAVAGGSVRPAPAGSRTGSRRGVNRLPAGRRFAARPLDSAAWQSPRRRSRSAPG